MPRPHGSQDEHESADSFKVTPEIAAEAAVWVARLHGPDRSRDMERECLAWQARSAANRMAFERCTDTWQDVANLTLSSYAAVSPAAVGKPRHHTFLARKRLQYTFAVCAAGLAAGVLAWQNWRDVDTYATDIGEQRVVVLDDSTRMSLNTATRVRVKLASAQRRVKVESGEVLFEVAKDARRPFVVLAAGSEVVAAGTVFSVRLTTHERSVDDALAITLVEGRVTVRAATEEHANGSAPERPLDLLPGDRVRLSEVVDESRKDHRRVVTQADRPQIEQVMAWKRDEAIFDNVSLVDAVNEMNRYSRTPIVLAGDGSLSEKRVSGMFRTGDNLAFARAVAALHGLVLRERRDGVELTSE